jgi:capsular polysaccharide biosynthesis protein
LPANIARREDLSPEASWFGYAMRDVPDRPLSGAALAQLSNMRAVAYRDGPKRNYTPALVGADGIALRLPQIAARPAHAERLRKAPRRRLDRGVWLAERVFDNYSHWLTAHLPKLVLLRDLGLAEGVILPAERPTFVDASLRHLGIEPDAQPQFDSDTVLEVRSLTVPVTDRFDPRLLRPVRTAFEVPCAGPPNRKVLISRVRARGRKLLEEDMLWPALEARGFERVCMEDLDFDGQRRLMAETGCLVAPHGAGLTNMMFCPEGADVLEIADPAYPNPNFYALACAMGHRYWLLPAEGRGTGHALGRDLSVEPDVLLAMVDRMTAASVEPETIS